MKKLTALALFPLIIPLMSCSDSYPNLKNTLKQYVDDGHVSGLSALVAQNDKILFNYQYGKANIEEGYNMTEDSVFRLASMTKPITAFAVLQCVDKGLIKLDDYVDQYISNFRNFDYKDDNGNVINHSEERLTIDQLLHHSSGFSSGNLEQKEFFAASRTASLESNMDIYKNFGLTFEPGTRHLYSAYVCFDVLARIVEIVTNTPYYTYLKDHIFNPLEMTHTAYTYDNVSDVDKVITYKDEGNTLIRDLDTSSTFSGFPIGYTGGGAGLCTTIGDYYNFCKMILNDGVFNGKTLISKQTLDLLSTAIDIPNHPDTSTTTRFARSVYVRPTRYDNGAPEGSFGWSGFYGTHFFIDKRNRCIAIYMHNSLSYGGAFAPHTFMFENAVVEALNLK